MDAFDFTKEKGIVREEDYPYKYSAREYKCQDTAKKEKVHTVGAKEEDQISVQRLKELLTKQPVGVAMHSN